jgi:hypothetical protein
MWRTKGTLVCSQTVRTPAGARGSAGLIRRTIVRMFHDHEKMPTTAQALPGRDEPVLEGRPAHLLFGEGSRYVPPFPKGLKVACFGNGCFWGPEMRFWEVPGVYSTAVGYCGGLTPNPTCVPMRARPVRLTLKTPELC